MIPSNYGEVELSKVMDIKFLKNHLKQRPNAEITIIFSVFFLAKSGNISLGCSFVAVSKHDLRPVATIPVFEP